MLHSEKSVTKNEMIFFQNDMLSDLKKMELQTNNKLTIINQTLSSKISEYDEKFTKVFENIAELISVVSERKFDNERIEDLLSMKVKFNELITQNQSRLQIIDKSLENSFYKYDRFILDNLQVPGLIGSSCKYKNCRMFFESIYNDIKANKKIKDEEKAALKAFQDKIDTRIFKCENELNKIHMNINEVCQTKCEKFFKTMEQRFDSMEEFMHSTRIENSKYVNDLIKTSTSLKIEYNKLENIKNEIYKKFNEELDKYKKLIDSTNRTFRHQENEFNIFKQRFTKLAEYLKDFKNMKNKDYNEVSKGIDFTKKQKFDNNFDMSKYDKIGDIHEFLDSPSPKRKTLNLNTADKRPSRKESFISNTKKFHINTTAQRRNSMFTVNKINHDDLIKVSKDVKTEAKINKAEEVKDNSIKVKTMSNFYKKPEEKQEEKKEPTKPKVQKNKKKTIVTENNIDLNFESKKKIRQIEEEEDSDSSLSEPSSSSSEISFSSVELSIQNIDKSKRDENTKIIKKKENKVNTLEKMNNKEKEKENAKEKMINKDKKKTQEINLDKLIKETNILKLHNDNQNEKKEILKKDKLPEEKSSKNEKNNQNLYNTDNKLKTINTNKSNTNLEDKNKNSDIKEFIKEIEVKTENKDAEPKESDKPEYKYQNKFKHNSKINLLKSKNSYISNNNYSEKVLNIINSSKKLINLEEDKGSLTDKIKEEIKKFQSISVTDKKKRLEKLQITEYKDKQNYIKKDSKDNSIKINPEITFPQIKTISSEVNRKESHKLTDNNLKSLVNINKTSSKKEFESSISQRIKMSQLNFSNIIHKTKNSKANEEPQSNEHKENNKDKELFSKTNSLFNSLESSKKRLSKISDNNSNNKIKNDTNIDSNNNNNNFNNDKNKDKDNTGNGNNAFLTSLNSIHNNYNYYYNDNKLNDNNITNLLCDKYKSCEDKIDKFGSKIDIVNGSIKSFNNRINVLELRYKAIFKQLNKIFKVVYSHYHHHRKKSHVSNEKEKSKEDKKIKKKEKEDLDENIKFMSRIKKLYNDSNEYNIRISNEEYNNTLKKIEPFLIKKFKNK